MVKISEQGNPSNYYIVPPLKKIKKKGLWIAFGEGHKYEAQYKDKKLLTYNGEPYEGEGVKKKKDGSLKATDSYLKAVIGELKSIEKFELTRKTSVVKVLQDSKYKFTIAKGPTYFDPGTFEKIYLYSNNATYEMTTKLNLSLQPFWDSKMMGYELLPPTEKGSGGIIYFNGEPSKGVKLGHEMFHAYDASSGNLIHSPIPAFEISIQGTLIGEIRASCYGNAIREFYNITPLRKKYHENQGYELLQKNGKPKPIPPNVFNKK